LKVKHIPPKILYKTDDTKEYCIHGFSIISNRQWGVNYFLFLTLKHSITVTSTNKKENISTTRFETVIQKKKNSRTWNEILLR